MTFEQLLRYTVYAIEAGVTLYAAAIILSGLFFARHLYKHFYAKSEIEVSSGAVWMDGPAVAWYAVILGLIWPYAWHWHFAKKDDPSLFFPFIPHGQT